MSLHLKAIAASDPFVYSTGVLKCRTGERGVISLYEKVEKMNIYIN